MIPVVDQASWAAPSDALVTSAVVCAFAPLLVAFVIPPRLAWGAFGVLIHPAIVVVALRLFADDASQARLWLYIAGIVTLGWSILELLLARRAGEPRKLEGPTHRTCLASCCRVAATVTGVASLFTLVSFLLVRGLDAVAPMGATFITGPAGPFASAWDGAGVIGALTLAGIARLMASGDRRVVTALFLLCVIGAAWAALAGTTSRHDPGVVWAGTGGWRVLLVGLSLVVCVFVGLHAWARRRRAWRLVTRDPDGLMGSIEEWPGFRKAAGGVTVFLVLLVCYELASAGGSGDRGWAMVLSVCAGCAGVATFSLLGQRWSVNLAEVAMGLVTLGVAALALAAIPRGANDTASRYPMVFNALMVGFATMTGFWIWIGKVWEQQLDRGAAWTTAGRIALLAPGFAFFVALLAVVNGSLMAVWPRLRPVGVFDDSLGRMAAGISGHLLLLLVVLWSGRRTGRSAFNALAVLVGMSLVGLVVIRAAPLSAEWHDGADIEARCVRGAEDASA